MNIKESENVVNLTGDMFQSKTLERGFIQKIISKKPMILRRTFLFLFGFTFYLIYSSL